MKINALAGYSKYSNQNFKAGFKNSSDINFSRSDMENGSIIAGTAALGTTGLFLSKMQNKSLLKGACVALLNYIAVSLFVLGAMACIKLIKNNMQNKEKTI